MKGHLLSQIQEQIFSSMTKHMLHISNVEEPILYFKKYAERRANFLNYHHLPTYRYLSIYLLNILLSTLANAKR